MGIFELLVINEEMERLIMERSNTGKIREAAIRRGMVTLREDGLSKVKEGYTTLAEVIRVTRDWNKYKRAEMDLFRVEKSEVA